MKKTVYVRSIPIGGNNRITIQSMTNTDTEDIEATKSQVKQLRQAGADFVRVSLPSMDCMKTVKELAKGDIPIIGDIHFDHKIAIAAVESGIDKIRINPSNFPKQGLADTVKACKEANIPIRVGVNKGSVKGFEADAQKLALLTLESAKRIEDLDYDNLVLAVKASDVKTTVKAYRILDKMCSYPLHIGLTEAGPPQFGILKSAVAIGSLLLDNIGDTLRVSLTAHPVEEVKAAINILRAAGKDTEFIDIIACPTCARTCINVQEIAAILYEKTKDIRKKGKIAVMGCIVNGIGESKGAKFGVAGGKDKSSIFLDSKIIKTVNNEEILQELLDMAKRYL